MLPPTPKAEGRTGKQIDRLVYVGITRAQDRLVMPHERKNWIIKRVKDSFKIVYTKEAIIL